VKSGSRPASTHLLLCSALVLAASFLVACSAAGPAQTTVSTGRLASAPPPSACGDNQPGRYEAAGFRPRPVTTAGYRHGLLADVYQPADDPAKCRVGVVWVHGGGFTRGSRDGDAEHAWGAALASRGYVLVSIDYRLAAGEPFGLDQATGQDREAGVAHAIADAQTALRWVRSSAAELGVDPDRVAIGGTSAGAMTAAGAALTAPADERVCTFVSVAGDIEPGWVGAAPATALFIHGDADDVVPYQSSVSAVDLLNGAGGRAELVTMAGAGHEITGVPTPDMVTAAARWLREHAADGCG